MSGGVETVQSNLTAGEFSPLLHSRIDVEKYFQGVAEATNMVIMPHGGMRRRPGLSKTQDTNVGSEGRMAKFIFNTTQAYIVLFRPGIIDIFRDGIRVKQITGSPYTTLDMCNDLDAIQSADTMFITHPDVSPRNLLRGATDADWTFQVYPILVAPPFDNFTAKFQDDGTDQVVDVTLKDIVRDVKSTPSHYYEATNLTVRTSVNLKNEVYATSGDWKAIGEGGDAWDDTRGWPVSCTLFQGRLWFGGSTHFPNSIWGSRTNGFAPTSTGGGGDFSLGADADHAIFDTLDTDQLNKITNIFTGRALQVFTTSNEFYNAAEIISPSDSQWKIQTGYGAKRLRPILVDGATFFIDSSKRSIRSFLYNFDEEAYVADNITLLSSHLIQDVLAMDSITGTATDISDFVYVVNSDGTVAVLNTLRSESVLGWTHWVTDGEFLDVVVLEKEVYFLVKRLGEFFIEKLTEDTYTDHNVASNDLVVPEYNVIFGTDNVIQGTDNVIYRLGAKAYLDTDFDAVFATTEFKVIADLNIMDEQTYTGAPGDNIITVPHTVSRLEAGLNFLTKVTTLPISAETQAGATLNRRKRIVKTYLNVYKSLGVYAKTSNRADRNFKVTLDQAALPYTGIREIYILGYNKLLELEISQTEPLPFALRSITYEIVY